MTVKVGWGEGGVSLSTVNDSEGGVGRGGVSLSTVNDSEGGAGRGMLHSLQHDDLFAHNGDGAPDASVRQLG